MTGEPTHTASKERMAPQLMFSSEHAPQLSKTASKVQWPLRFAFSYIYLARYTALQMKNNRRSASATIQSPRKYDDSHAPTINYHLESAVAITLCFQLCSTCYTALQTKNSVRIVSAISPVTMENTDDPHLQTYCREAMHRATANRRLGLSAKRNGTQRRTKVSP